MKYDGARLPELLDDLDAALRELTGSFERSSAGWDQGPPGKWSAGQHVEHVGRMLAMSAELFELAADALQRGDLPRRPWRDPLQALFVAWVTGKRFPKGGQAPQPGAPSAAPDLARALALVAQGGVRHRGVATRLAPEQCHQIWIWNPYAPQFRWHYTLPEMVRVHANHARHHRGALAAIAGQV